ncbi:MAG: purine-binding chemotaxis protein CheW [Deltaproteobacteria bacterium]|nr:purine-binding chemotaxis protein CheW [Deltaproteobacteria bacterium]
MRLVCFELRGQELALPIDDVRETLPIQPITRVVLTPPALAGVFSLRGDIVPAIDLGVLFGFPRTEIGDHSRIIVLDQTITAGIVVDRLRDLRTLDEALEAPPPSLSTEISELLLGIAATPTGTVRVLDAAAIIAAEPLRALAKREEESK